MGTLGHFNRAKTPRKLPVVLTRIEIKTLLHNVEGIPKLVASLLYGSGLRRNEAMRGRGEYVDGFDLAAALRYVAAGEVLRSVGCRCVHGWISV